MKSCKICYDSKQGDILIKPCKCKGSLGYVHPMCLKEHINMTKQQKCVLCNQKYLLRKYFKKHNKYSIMRKMFKNFLSIMPIIRKLGIISILYLIWISISVIIFFKLFDVPHSLISDIIFAIIYPLILIILLASYKSISEHLVSESQNSNAYDSLSSAALRSGQIFENRAIEHEIDHEHYALRFYEISKQFLLLNMNYDELFRNFIRMILHHSFIFFVYFLNLIGKYTLEFFYRLFVRMIFYSKKYFTSSLENLILQKFNPKNRIFHIKNWKFIKNQNIFYEVVNKKETFYDLLRKMHRNSYNELSAQGITAINKIFYNSITLFLGSLIFLGILLFLKRRRTRKHYFYQNLYLTLKYFLCEVSDLLFIFYNGYFISIKFIRSSRIDLNNFYILFTFMIMIGYIYRKFIISTIKILKKNLRTGLFAFIKNYETSGISKIIKVPYLITYKIIYQILTIFLFFLIVPKLKFEIILSSDMHFLLLGRQFLGVWRDIHVLSRIYDYILKNVIYLFSYILNIQHFTLGVNDLEVLEFDCDEVDPCDCNQEFSDDSVEINENISKDKNEYIENIKKNNIENINKDKNEDIENINTNSINDSPDVTMYTINDPSNYIDSFYTANSYFKRNKKYQIKPIYKTKKLKWYENQNKRYKKSDCKEYLTQEFLTEEILNNFFNDDDQKYRIIYQPKYFKIRLLIFIIIILITMNLSLYTFLTIITNITRIIKFLIIQILIKIRKNIQNTIFFKELFHKNITIHSFFLIWYATQRIFAKRFSKNYTILIYEFYAKIIWSLLLGILTQIILNEELIRFTKTYILGCILSSNLTILLEHFKIITEEMFKNNKKQVLLRFNIITIILILLIFGIYKIIPIILLFYFVYYIYLFSINWYQRIKDEQFLRSYDILENYYQNS